MINLRQRIESVMRSEPGKSLGLSGMLLYLLSLVYGLAMRLRYKLYALGVLKTGHAPCQVVSVGNITLGGTGKTPMTIHLARLFQKWGLRVAIASRGYGGTMQKQGGVVSDGKAVLCSSTEAGDEPWLMAVKLPGIPVVVGGNRVKSGNLCVEKFNTQVLILDDAFSHLAIARDLNLLLVDSKAPFGNGHVFPRGVLREPAVFANRADAVIKTRTERGSGKAALPSGKPVFLSNHKPGNLVKHNPSYKQEAASLNDRRPASLLDGNRILAFSGIADNAGFFNSLRGLGADVAETLSFPDHHGYTIQDRNVIVERAIKAGVQTLVTTEKDLVRLANWDAHGLNLYALEITMAIENEAEFETFLKSKIKIGDP